MFRISLKYLKNKRRECLRIILAVFFLSMVSVFAVQIAGNICERKKEQATEVYGSFVAGDIAENEAEIPEVKADYKIGLCRMTGEYEYDNVRMPIGAADEFFMKLTACTLTNGRLPEKENEIAMQEYALSLLGLSVGDTFTLDKEKEGKEYIITGSVNNYSKTLDVSSDEYQRLLYPVIFLSSAAEADQEYISYLLGYEDTKTLSVDAETELSKLNNVYLGEWFSVFNNHLYYVGLDYYIYLLTISKIFSAAIFAVSVIISISLYRLLYKKIRKELAILEVLGLKPEKRAKPLFVQSIILTLCAFLISIGAFAIISAVSSVYVNVNIATGFRTLLAWYGIYFAIWALITYIRLKVLSSLSVKENIYSNEKTKNGNKGQVIALGIIKYAGLFISVAACLLFMNILNASYTELPDYQLLSIEGEVAEVEKGYGIRLNSFSPFDIRDTDSVLEKYPGITSELLPEVGNNYLAVKKSYKNVFLDNWQGMYSEGDTDVLESMVKNKLPDEALRYVPLGDFSYGTISYIVVSTAEYKELTGGAENASEGGVVIYVPHTGDPGIEQEDFEFCGITLGKEISFTLYDIKADAILNAQDIDKIHDNIQTYNNGYFDQNIITVFLNKEYLEDYPIVLGYKEIFVYFNDGFLEFDAIDNDLNLIQSRTQGGIIYSKAADEERAAAFNSYISATGSLLIALILVFAVIYVICSTLLYIKNSRREIGIKMILGKQRKSFVLEKGTRSLGIVGIGIALGVAATILMMVYARDSLLYQPDSVQISIFILPAIIVFLIMITECLVFALFLRKTEEKDCIYKEI